MSLRLTRMPIITGLMVSPGWGSGGRRVSDFVTVAFSATLHPYPIPFRIPALAIVAYALMANLCYSLGPILDGFIHRRWGPEYAVVGPTLFRYGFVFSVGLTLLPIPVSMLLWFARLLGS